MSETKNQVIKLSLLSATAIGLYAGAFHLYNNDPSKEFSLVKDGKGIPAAIAKTETKDGAMLFPTDTKTFFYSLDSANVKKFSNLEQNLNAIKDFGSGKNGNEVEKILNAELQNYVDSVDAVKTR